MSTLSATEDVRAAEVPHFRWGFERYRWGFEPSNTEEQRASHAFRIFSFLWATAALFHYAAYPERLVGLGAFLLLVSAIGVLFRPGSLWRFMVMIGLQVAVVINTYPVAVSNHWLFGFFVNLTIFIALSRLVLSKRRSVDTGSLFLEFAPVVRVELILLYFFAVLHKLNVDFLNPAISCASVQYLDLARSLPFLPTADWILAALPYATLVVEAAIPLLLCFRKTRVAGVLLGMLFHAMLALNPAHTFYDFSSVVYAGYYLFIPYDYIAMLRTHWAGTAVGRWVGALAHRGLLQRAFRFLMLGLGVLLAWNWAYQFFTHEPIFTTVPGLVEVLKIGNIVVWSLYAVGLVSILLRAAFAERLVRSVRGLDMISLRSPVLAIIPVLLVVNGLNPYVGLKTESAFSMFSNLQTEGGHSNHLFMPVKYRVAGYQEDLVRVVETTHPYLQEKADQGYIFPYFEFKRIIGRRKNASVKYIQNNEVKTVPRVADDPELSRPEPFLLRKLLDFRPVDTYEIGCRCSH